MERLQDAFYDDQPGWKPLNERLGTNQPNERLQRMIRPRPRDMDARMPVPYAAPGRQAAANRGPGGQRAEHAGNNSGQGLLRPVRANNGIRKKTIKTTKRKSVPMEDWQGYKAWAANVKNKPFKGSDTHREVKRAYLDEYYRYKLRQEGYNVPNKAQPSYGYSVDEDTMDYIQKGSDEVLDEFYGVSDDDDDETDEDD
ncbi:MAG: hypothetical protein Q9225_005991 [Loekoesia sp. 1 TL-2023]